MDLKFFKILKYFLVAFAADFGQSLESGSRFVYPRQIVLRCLQSDFDLCNVQKPLKAAVAVKDLQGIGQLRNECINLFLKQQILGPTKFKAFANKNFKFD